MINKTDSVVIILPKIYGDMYGVYLSTLATWTGKGTAYIVYSSNSPSYEPDAANKAATLRSALATINPNFGAYKTTHVEGSVGARQRSMAELFKTNKPYWQYANLVYSLDEIGTTALVESQGLVSNHVRWDNDRMCAMTYRFDECSMIKGQMLVQCLALTRSDIVTATEPNFAGSNTADRLQYFQAVGTQTLEVVQYRTGSTYHGGNNFWDAFRGDYEYQTSTNITSKNYTLPGACWIDEYSRPHYLYCGNNNWSAYRDLALKLFGNTVVFNAIKPNGQVVI